jgi:hypothetical protein
MATEPAPIPAHSVAEAYLYLMVAPCRACGNGPLRHQQDLTRRADGKFAMTVMCSACAATTELSFTIEPEPSRDEARSTRINPTPQPSRSIDLLGWLTLFSSIMNTEEKETNKTTVRELACEAGQCLDEAMKFYAADNDLPADGAFFSENSLRRFRDHPQQFSRSKWRERRLKLPDAEVTSVQRSDGRPWWKFWN